MDEIRIKRSAITSDAGAEPKFHSGWLWVLLCSGATSISCLIAGLGISLLSALHILTSSPPLAHLTVGLLMAWFVSLVLSAHCLDRLWSIERAEQVAYWRKHGLDDQEVSAKQDR